MAWFKGFKLKDILSSKAAFSKFVKLILLVVGSILSILGMAYLIFVFHWSCTKKDGLNCGGKPVNVKDLKK